MDEPLHGQADGDLYQCRCVAAAFNSGGTNSIVAREFSGSKLSPGDPHDNRFYGLGFYPVHETID